ncbi:MAG TPA: hypothetical protein PLU67_02655 [Candidatus Kapabacteria bacterium]|nr:hypothetical protein [Candidatus Kapabacteria bacterium]HOM04375.1 hypothetical protein [Candidatus Kapabacteria bacterium]HPP38683.1 hypothetical protein [Candidatus Kapabacteria bacterium]
MSRIFDQLVELAWMIFKFIMWVLIVMFVIGGMYSLIRDFINSF